MGAWGEGTREEKEEAEPCTEEERDECAMNCPIVSISGGVDSVQSDFLSGTT